MFAFAIIDQRTEDGSFPFEEKMEDLFEIKAVRAVFISDTAYYEQVDIDIHTCTDEEIEQFYEPDKYVAQYLPVFRSRLLCLDSDQLILSGDQWSGDFSKISLFFNIKEQHCRNDTYDSECVVTRTFDESLNWK